jgi:hypothetical protein
MSATLPLVVQMLGLPLIRNLHAFQASLAVASLGMLQSIR